jgi:hypothetical protein
MNNVVPLLLKYKPVHIIVNLYHIEYMINIVYYSAFMNIVVHCQHFSALHLGVQRGSSLVFMIKSIIYYGYPSEFMLNVVNSCLP